MGNPELLSAVTATSGSTVGRSRCQHGEKCFRQNPDHKTQFSHPGDCDWDVPQDSVKTGYHTQEAPLAPLAGEEEDVEDRGLMGAAGGAAAVLGAGAVAHQAGALGWARRHPGMALVGGAAAVVAGAVAGSKLEDHMAENSSETKPVTGGHGHASKPLCKYFVAGHCKDGRRCRYSHSNPTAHATMGGGSRGRHLVVHVKNATGLRNTDGPFAGKSDPYVILCLVDGNGKTVAGPKQTSVKDDTLNPVWNEDIVFEGLDTPAAYTLRVNVFDKDTFLGTGHLDWLSPDDKLGDGKVDLGTLYNTRDFQDKELVIERRKLGLFKATLNISLSTQGQWGN